MSKATWFWIFMAGFGLFLIAVAIAGERRPLIRADDEALAREILACLTPLSDTDRELVLPLLVQGWSNLAIADRLGMAPGTAEAHVHQIITRLRAESRTEAVYRASLLGLVRRRSRSEALAELRRDLEAYDD